MRNFQVALSARRRETQRELAALRAAAHAETARMVRDAAEQANRIVVEARSRWIG